MEMRGSDFSKRNNKDVLVITLGSEEESFDLRLMVPTKGIYEDILHAAELAEAVMNGEANPSDYIDELYGHVCRAMSYNTDARSITPEFLEEMGFTFADAGAFIGDYTQFILLLATQKN